MKTAICCIGIGGWYPRGVARLIGRMWEVDPGHEIQAHVNVLPWGAPVDVVEDGYDYTGYTAKPFALAHARQTGADIAILVDAAFFPIRPIQPLVDHIAQKGYYLCRNGATVGEWSSDRCLERMNVSRTKAMEIQEASGYCVGVNFANGRAIELVQRWCGFAADRLTFAGPHTAMGHEGRNRGDVSKDPSVKGHRHDQTALSILAHQLGMTELVERPRFTAYLGHESSETVLVNEGMA